MDNSNTGQHQKNKIKNHSSHLFINEPVWAIVLAAFIVLLGLKALFEMQVRKFPEIEQGAISIRSTYAGAPADLMQSAVTKPLSRVISQADGIDFIESETMDSSSEIRAFLKVNYPLDKAFTDILSQVQSAKRELPSDIDDPQIVKGTGNSIALLYVAYTSDDLNPSLVYNYLDNVIRPQLSIIPGVGEIQILGAQPPAMRIWLDFEKMQSYSVSIDQVNYALSTENFLLPSGRIKNSKVESTLVLDSQGKTVEDFENTIILQTNDGLVTLGDIARIEFGAKNYESEVIFNGKKGVFLSVDMLPAANALTVIQAVRNYLEGIEPSLPENLKQQVVYDATTFIYESIVEVIKTTMEAVVIVLVVMYLFLKSSRAVFISIIAIPLSLLGAAFMMQAAGFSINLLTLLAMILAIGLVIDDAIIVVENCSRYIEEGDPPILAAKKGIQEIASAVVAMTLTLAIAYAPMIFLDGLVGGLFKEFAFTLASSVLVSGVVALCLSPMMCAYLLRAGQDSRPPWLMRMTDNYTQKLEGFFENARFVAVFTFLLLGLNALLFSMLSSSLAPKEDQGFALIAYNAPKSNNLSLLSEKSEKIKTVIDSFDEKQDYFLINGTGSAQAGFGGFVAKPIQERSRSMEALEKPFREKFSEIVGLEVFSFTPAALPGTDGLPFQIVLYGPASVEELYTKGQELQERLLSSGLFPFARTNVKLNKPELHLEFSENKLKLAGLSSLDVAGSLLQSLADNSSGQFDWFSEQLDVIVKSQELSYDQVLKDMPLFDSSGSKVALEQLAKSSVKIAPDIRYQFNQLNAISIEGMMFPIYSQSDALDFLEEITSQYEQDGLFVDYLGQTRTYVQEGSGLNTTFAFALIIIYLVLSAQFRSFVDPFIILLTVPLALSGTLFMMNLSWVFTLVEGYKHFDINLNIYTQLGLLTLVGLITKHGVLIVEFANERLLKGLSPREAALSAARERFRPIIMTTATMVAGVTPLLFATGSGSVSRLHIGSVIISGLSVGTLFTLFIIPVIYALMKKRIPAQQIREDES